MPKREIVFATGEIYHLYNRSIAKERIFTNMIQLRKILEIFDYYIYQQRLSLSKFKQLPKEIKKQYLREFEKKQPVVEIHAFSIMPTHYHLLVKQLADKGISRFISNFQNSYAKHYNVKNNRDGSLFKNQFKGKWIESTEQYIHTSRYIHLNPVTAYMIPLDQLDSFQWTSFPGFIGNNNLKFLTTTQILRNFTTPAKYKEFIQDQSDYQKSIKVIKDVMINK